MYTQLSPHVRVKADSPKLLAQYKLLKARWEGCTKCPLHEFRTNVVHFRGTLPCDVLFIGEAPGESEDVLRYPFVGEAGAELDNLLADIAVLTGEFVYGITNVVACKPTLEGSIREPSTEEAQACRPRLESLIELCQPKLFVTLGQVAKKHLPRDASRLVCQVMHPSAIIREHNDIMRKMHRRRFSVTVAESIGYIHRKES